MDDTSERRGNGRPCLSVIRLHTVERRPIDKKDILTTFSTLVVYSQYPRWQALGSPLGQKADKKAQSWKDEVQRKRARRW